jgi:hypothetical protein
MTNEEVNEHGRRQVTIACLEAAICPRRRRSGINGGILETRMGRQ